MRTGQRDHASVASSTSVAANVGSSVRISPTTSPRLADSGSVCGVASELIRYVSDDVALAAAFSAVGENMPAVADGGKTATPMSSDPVAVSVALQHQQLRAQVLVHGFRRSESNAGDAD